jgi:aspartate dehydrogenase
VAGARKRIGIVGFGQIGSYVYRHLSAHPEIGIDVAFVFDVAQDRLAGLPEGLVLDDIARFATRGADMVCEFAHPDVSRRFGAMFLGEADYFLLSVTAMADAALEHTLTETALRRGRRLYIPHGGVLGLDAIIEGRDAWQSVTLVMKKNPRNIDFARSGFDPATIDGVTTVYDGPTRGICPLYPKNVNTHATLALAGIGFDRTRSVLVADPALTASVVEIYAHSETIDLELRRTNAIKGVTGVSTFASVAHSVASTALGGPGLRFC